MQPRYYTISSSSSCHPDTVHITVAITRKLLGNGKIFNGLCSNYLDGLSPKV
jgi:NADPH-ferrihemoprotein reductase